MEQFDQLMDLVLKPAGNAPIYNCMLTVHDGKRNISYSSAAGTFHEGGEDISPACRFRTGSMTKPFTAAVILQLIEEGFFSAEDLFFDLAGEEIRRKLSGLHVLEAIDYSSDISVLHLLQHRSGLRDYFSDDERFLAYVMQHPSQSWNWRQVMEKYFEYGLNQKPAFRPSEGFYYADTNYLLLAVLIEKVTGKTQQQVFEERIIVPLGLKDTFLEFYQLPHEPAPIVYPHYGSVYLKDVNTSFDWGGGGLVSSMKDLDVFIRSLVKGLLFQKDKTLKMMMQFDIAGHNSGSSKRVMRYGLGLQQKEFPDYLFWGHNSAYASMVYYDREKDLSIVLTLNQAGAVHKAEWMMNRVISILREL